MSKQYRDLLNQIKKETKNINHILSVDEQDQLIFKITNKDIKEALKTDSDTKALIPHFKEEYKTKINEVRKYSMVDAESFKLVFDEKVSQENKQLFLIAWTRFFANNIIKQSQDHSKIKRRMFWYLLFGILTILIYTAIQVCAVIYSDQIPSMRIVAVCFESLLILAWVLLWNFFELLIEDLPLSKTKMIDLYLMYEGTGEITKPGSKPNTSPVAPADPVQVEFEKIRKEILALEGKCKLSTDPKTITDPVVQAQLIKVQEMIKSWNKPIKK